MNDAVKRTVWLANAGLLLLVGYVGYGVWKSPDAKTPVEPPAAVAPPATSPEPDAPQETYNAIVARNLFGAAAGAREAKPPTPEPTPGAGQPALQLRLLGTVSGPNAVSRAVIEDLSSRVQDVYKVGDVVQGAEIAEIHEEKVILKRAGARYALGLSVAQLIAVVAEAGGETPVETKTVLDSAVDAVRTVAENKFEINKRSLLARIGGMEAVLKAVKVTPYVEDGETKGLRLDGLDNVSMARFVGLRNGDVLQEVNGQLLNSPQKAFQVFRKARQQSSIDVQLLREGKKVRLSYGVE